MTGKITAPLIAATLALGVTVPVMAAYHGSFPPSTSPGTMAPTGSGTSGPTESVAPLNQTSSQQGNVPSEAVSQGFHASGNPMASLSPHRFSSLPSQARSETAARHSNGPSANVLADVKAMQALREKIHTARLQYVAAIRQYLQALSHALSDNRSQGVQTAVAQLKTINTTLAQTVKTEMAAKTAAASTGSHSGTSALSNVIAKFQAEWAALTQATAQVKALTETLSSTIPSGTPGPSQTTPTTSPSTPASTS